VNALREEFSVKYLSALLLVLTFLSPGQGDEELIYDWLVVLNDGESLHCAIRAETDDELTLE